jgi:hypothetical protein
LSGGFFDSIRIRDIHRDDEPLSTEFFDLLPRAFQSVDAAREQPEPRAVFCKSPRGRASNSCGRASDYDNFRSVIHKTELESLRQPLLLDCCAGQHGHARNVKAQSHGVFCKQLLLAFFFFCGSFSVFFDGKIGLSSAG